MPHSSSNGMQAMTPSGMPGASTVEGFRRKGKGISDPIRTSGDHLASVRSSRRSARNTIGGIPTPPPTSSVRGRCGSGVNPLPMGPRTLMRSPARFCDSNLRPGPTILYRMSIQPPFASARMIDSGLRIGSSASQLRWAKLPGVAAAAVRGACSRRTNWSPSNASCERIVASSSRKIVPR